MASLTVDRSVGDDTLLAIRRVPVLIAQFLATALRLVLVGVELLLSLVSVPLTLPFLLLRVLAWACSMLDTTLAGGTQAHSRPRNIPDFSAPETPGQELVRRPERTRQYS